MGRERERDRPLIVAALVTGNEIVQAIDTLDAQRLSIIAALEQSNSPRTSASITHPHNRQRVLHRRSRTRSAPLTALPSRFPTPDLRPDHADSASRSLHSMRGLPRSILSVASARVVGRTHERGRQVRATPPRNAGRPLRARNPKFKACCRRVTLDPFPDYVIRRTYLFSPPSAADDLHSRIGSALHLHRPAVLRVALQSRLSRSFCETHTARCASA